VIGLREFAIIRDDEYVDVLSITSPVADHVNVTSTSPTTTTTPMTSRGESTDAYFSSSDFFAFFCLGGFFSAVSAEP